MLPLNYELLTSDRIVAYCKKNIASLQQPQPSGSKRPSDLVKLKEKLKQTFFEMLIKPSDNDALALLENDSRFTDYPKLKSVLHLLLQANEATVGEALSSLESLAEKDWTPFDNFFDEYDKTHGYFKGVDGIKRDLLRDLFLKLATSCHVMSVFLENEPEKAEAFAYQYAYKCMALLVDPDLGPYEFDKLSFEINKVLSNTDVVMPRPLHDALLVKLEPLPLAQEINNRVEWKAFILKNGVKGFPYWLMAGRLEKRKAEKEGTRDRHAPRDLKEAAILLSEIRYENSWKDLEFSALCHRYKVPEKRFQEALNYIESGWPKKNSDLLPNLMITGQGDAEGFFWVKMPPQDKRALILGDITDCCQSIGGNSEACVKDSVSLQHNGLYVLLKKEKKSENTPSLIVDGQINDKDFKIVAQSYAWLSQSGDLCLDSLESLQGEVSLDTLRAILRQFSEAVFAHSAPRMVTVGRGGKTPEGLSDHTNAIYQEMQEGYKYGDSGQQYTIGMATLHLALEKVKTLKAIFSKAHPFVLEYLYVHLGESDKFFNTIEELFSKDSPLKKIIDALSDKNNNLHNKAILLLVVLEHQGLLNATNFDFLFKTNRPNAVKFMLDFYKSGLQDKIELSNLSKYNKTKKVYEYLDTLLELDKAGLSDEKYLDLVFSSTHPDACAKALITFKEMNLDEKYLDLVFSSVHPDACAKALITFKEMNALDAPWVSNFFNTAKNDFTLSRDLHLFASAFSQLKTASLLSSENIEQLLRIKSSKVSEMRCMSENGLLNQANFERLLRVKNSKSREMDWMNQNGLLNQANFERLLTCDNSFYLIRDANSLFLLTGPSAQANFETIMSIRNRGFYEIMDFFHSEEMFHTPELQAIFTMVVSYLESKEPGDLIPVLDLMRESNLLTKDVAQKNFKRLVSLSDLKAFHKALSESSPCTQEVFDALANKLAMKENKIPLLKESLFALKNEESSENASAHVLKK